MIERVSRTGRYPVIIVIRHLYRSYPMMLSKTEAYRKQYSLLPRQLSEQPGWTATTRAALQYEAADLVLKDPFSDCPV